MQRNLFCKFLTYIYLLGCIQSMMIKRGKYCKKRIIESYNLTSFTTFRNQNLFLCPAISSSCCSHYEQFTMYAEWKHKYKAKFEEYQDNIRKKIRRLKVYVDLVMNMDIKKRMKKLRITRAQRGKLIFAIHRMKSFDHKKIFRQLQYFQDANDRFMLRLRQSFYCQICDFNNHYWMHMKEQSLDLSQGSCQYLAENTSTYSYILNVKLVMFMWFMNKVMIYFANPNVSPKPITLLSQKKVVRAVKSCGKQFIKKGYVEGAICNKYCEYFNMNGNMPVFEGYHRYFNDQINFMKSLLDYQDIKVPRILSSNLTHFSKKQLSNIKDPYSHKSEDPIYTDYFINQMYNFEQFYDQGRKKGYVNFVKNKYSFFDVSIIPGGKDKQLFKTTPVEVVKLENYIIKVKPRGVEFAQHVKINNMNTTYRDLIYHLKNRTPHKIAYEKLDPTLIKNLNEISNTEIRDFHADNFQNFVDYSSEQISQSIKRKPDLSIYKGYDLPKI